MDGTHFTFTTLALIVLIVILLLMFVCHFFGVCNVFSNGYTCSSQSLFTTRHSANGDRDSSGGSSNKEKIGLSAASKLFQANGYVLHSGSDFLLSTSGSFKRFNSIDREDYNKTQQQQQKQQQALLAFSSTAVAAATSQQTTPLWNLTQQNIPPQPLRPAPQAPDSAGLNKTVTFSFRNELPTTTATMATGNVALKDVTGTAQRNCTELQTPSRSVEGKALTSCMKFNSSDCSGKANNHKNLNVAHSIPQLIQPPPAPIADRLLATSTSSGSMNNNNSSSTVIPRPIGLRQPMSLQNGTITNAHLQHATTLKDPKHGDVEQLQEDVFKKASMRQNMSNNTNPFLCEDANAMAKGTVTGDAMKPIEQQQQSVTTMNVNIQKNPFLGDISCTHEPFIPHTNDMQHHHTHENPLLQQQHKQQTIETNLLRNRSFSETDDELKSSLSNRLITSSNSLRIHATNVSVSTTTSTISKNPFNELKQKMKGPHLLQKTISEDFLFRKTPIYMNGSHATAQQEHQNGQTLGGSFRHAAHALLHRQNSTVSLSGTNGCSASYGNRTNSQWSLDSAFSTALSGGVGSMDSINLVHGISCDSVNSDSSSNFITSLDQTYTQITGYLRVGLHYDKNDSVREGMILTVSVLEAKELICPLNVPSLDTFVRIYLVPDHAAAMQTKVVYNSETPMYDESFNCWLKKQPGGRHSLWFHLYHSSDVHTLIGETEMEISEIPRPIITWIPLSDSRKCNAKWGELMFSLSYLPTAERLTIVIVKARNLKREICTANNPLPQKVHSIYVKVYLMNNEKKVLKKRTTMRRCDRGTIFNEAIIFSVPPHGLTTVQLRLTVFGLLERIDGSSGDGTTPQSSGSNGGGCETTQKFVTLGHVITGSCCTGKGLRHWHQMLSSLRKPVAMWHVLRAAINQPVFTGGAEAVVEAMQQCNNTLRTKRNSVY